MFFLWVIWGQHSAGIDVAWCGVFCFYVAVSGVCLIWLGDQFDLLPVSRFLLFLLCTHCAQPSGFYFFVRRILLGTYGREGLPTSIISRQDCLEAVVGFCGASSGGSWAITRLYGPL